MQIYEKSNGGQRDYKGHIVSLLYDIQKLADIFSRHPKHIPVVVFNFRDNTYRELKLRRKNIEDTSAWLAGNDENDKPNKFLYKDITICRDLLSVDGYSSEKNL